MYVLLECQYVFMLFYKSIHVLLQLHVHHLQSILDLCGFLFEHQELNHSHADGIVIAKELSEI